MINSEQRDQGTESESEGRGFQWTETKMEHMAIQAEEIVYTEILKQKKSLQGTQRVNTLLKFEFNIKGRVNLYLKLKKWFGV